MKIIIANTTTYFSCNSFSLSSNFVHAFAHNNDQNFISGFGKNSVQTENQIFVDGSTESLKVITLTQIFKCIIIPSRGSYILYGLVFLNPRIVKIFLTFFHFSFW